MVLGHDISALFMLGVRHIVGREQGSMSFTGSYVVSITTSITSQTHTYFISLLFLRLLMYCAIYWSHLDIFVTTRWKRCIGELSVNFVNDTKTNVNKE